MLALQNVHKTYRRGGLLARREVLPVLRGVDLALETGATLALVGRSGSGKSTLGRLALGIEKPDRGVVLYEGQDIHRSGREHFLRFRRDVQVVFQNVHGAVNPRLRAGDIVAEPLGNFERLTPAETRRRVGDLFELVGLSAKDTQKHPHQFSGGELQRICIARALAPRPRVVILDEAVSSLDMLVQERILNLLRRLRQESNAAYLLVTHDLRVVRHLCPEMAVLAEGRIVQRGEPAQLLKSSDAHPALRELAAALLPAQPQRTV